MRRDHRSSKLGDSRAPIAGLQKQNLETRRVRALRSAPPPLAAAHLLVLRLELVVVRREGARPRATAGALGGGAAGVRAPRVAGGEGGREAGEAEERRDRRAGAALGRGRVRVAAAAAAAAADGEKRGGRLGLGLGEYGPDR